MNLKPISGFERDTVISAVSIQNMRGLAYIVLIQALFLTAEIGAASSTAPGSKNGTTAQPPAFYINESAARILTIEMKDFGKVKVMLRSSWSPGSYNEWRGLGHQTEKGIVFTKELEEGEDSGLEFLAAVSQSKVTVKVKPGKGKPQENELAGVYHRISEEKLTALAKKDSEAAEKKLVEDMKTASAKAATEDKPGISEWKHRWPELRKKLAARLNKPLPVSPKSEVVTKLPLGQTKPAQSEKTAAQWTALAEASAAGCNFISQKVTAETKAEWEGEYEDGFGGSLSLKLQKSGELEFSFRCTRETGAEEVYYAGVCPPAMMKAKAKGKEATAEYIDNNVVVKGSEQKTSVQFKLYGRYLLVEIEYPREFMNRAWLDGIYLKRPPPTNQ